MSERSSRLIRLIEEKSLIRGADIRLTSGAKSTFYINMKPTIFDPEGANLIADLIVEALGTERVDLIGGLELGAVPIVACVCQKSFSGKPIRGFFVRKEPKAHGTEQRIEGIARGEVLTGKYAVLIEDVTTTGGSVLKAVLAARDAGCSVTKAITVVDRLEGAAENLSNHGVELVALTTARDFGL